MTPPDRSVEEIEKIVEEIWHHFDGVRTKDEIFQDLRTTLTSLHTLGIEAGRREGMNLEKVTRFEVIDHRASYEEGGGRVFTARGEDLTVSLSLQDDERTLKVFLTPQ